MPDLPDDLAIHARAVTRVYKAKPEPVTALGGVDLDVQPGEYFGLLGPNGAGKTTLIKILTTLLLPTSGTARVAGFDVETETAKIRRVINMVAGGEQSGYGLLTLREQLWMFSQFYGLSYRDGWRKVDELIEITGLVEQKDQKVRTLSTGQRQKLNFARGLLNDPWVLFLDEPTLGLDVAAARDLREHTLAWKAAAPGRTLLLTTHYMVEAEQLCDRIAIVDRGRILALGTPEELRRRVQGESIFRIELDQMPGGGGLAAIGALPGVLSAVMADEDGADGAGVDRVALKVALTDDSALTSVVTAVAERGSQLVGLAKSEPSLEDVFVELVGRGFGDGDGKAWRGQGVMTTYDSTQATNSRDAAEWSRGRVVRVNLRAVFGRAYPRIIGLTREPSWLFFEIFLPFLAVSAFVFVYRALDAPEEYIGFVVVGGAMTAFWLNVVWMMAAQFYWEKDQGNLELYFSAPMHLMSILAGMAIGGLVMTSSRALAVIAIGSLLYGVTYDIQQPWLLVAVFFMTMIPLYGLGMLFASLFLMWGREANHFAELLQEPIYFLGGVNFPLAAIGPIAGLMIATLPLAVGLDAMRQLVFAGSETNGVLPVGTEIAILAVMGVVFLVGARIALKHLEYLARREGRLTLRWQ